MAGPHGHHGGHHHGGGHHRIGGRRGGDVVFVESSPVVLYDECPPGFAFDRFGICRPYQDSGNADAGALPSAVQIALDGVKQVWGAIDGAGRDFSSAISAAYARAASKKWTSDRVGVSDLTALVVLSALDSRALREAGDNASIRAADALDRTWYVISKRNGYQAETAQAQKDANKDPKMTAAVPLIAIVAAIAATLIIAGVYVYLIYQAASIIDRQLARDVESDELVRLHAEWQKIVDRHIADPNAPWTPEEIATLKRLEDAQAGIRQAIAPPPPEPPKAPGPNWTVLGVAVVAAGAGYFFFLRKPKT